MISQERGGNFLLSPASAGEVHNSIFDGTVSVTRNDFLVSSEPYVGIFYLKAVDFVIHGKLHDSWKTT